jgi:hypothetical protein
VEHLFKSLHQGYLRTDAACSNCESRDNPKGLLEAQGDQSSGSLQGDEADYREDLYVSEKLLIKISKYLEREPQVLRCEEINEEGWFNKKESYIQKRLRHKRSEARYHLGISNIYRSYNGKRITKYQLLWLYERDVFYINKGLELEPGGEFVPMDTLTNLYNVIYIDKEENNKKG